MEIAKVEFVAVSDVAKEVEQDQASVLADLQLSLVGGGQGDIHLA